MAPLKSIDLCGALVLVAEFDRWQRLRSIVLSPETVNNWDINVFEKLESLGFFDILKTDRKSIGISCNKKDHWIPFISKTNTIGSAAKALRRELTKLLKNSVENKFIPIYAPLIESMKNAIDHAYEDTQDSDSSYPFYGKRWWMTASYDEDKKKIEVAFLDLGITIPRTLPKSWLWSKIHLKKDDSNQKFKDSSIIASAMSYRISRTEQYQRGKGFENIAKPVSLNTKNTVKVISRKGHCIMVSSGRIYAAEVNPEFEGTLIHWTIYL